MIDGRARAGSVSRSPDWLRQSGTALAVVALCAAYGLGADRSPRLTIALTVGAFAVAAMTAGLRYVSASPALRHRGLMGRVAAWASVLAIASLSSEALRVTSSISVGDVLLVGALVALAVGWAMGEVPAPWVPAWLGVAALSFLGPGLVTGGFAAHGSAMLQLGQFNPAGFATNSSAMLQLGELVTALVAGTLVIGWAVRSADLAVRAADAWTAGAFLSAFVAVVDFTFHTGIGTRVSGRTFAGREAGLTLQPNDLGITIALVAPWVVLRIVDATTPTRRAGWAIAAGVLGGGLFVSGSRSALLAVPVGIAAMMLVDRGVSRRLLAGLACVGVVVVGVVVVGGAESNSMLVAIHRLTTSSGTVAASDAVRVGLDHAAVESFLNHPFLGGGYQNVRQALNIYLQLAASGGVLAVAGFATFVVCTLRLNRSTAVTAERPVTRLLACALFGSMIVWLTYGVFQNGIYERYLYIAAGLTLALGLEQRAKLRNEQPGDATPDKRGV